MRAIPSIYGFYVIFIPLQLPMTPVSLPLRFSTFPICFRIFTTVFEQRLFECSMQGQLVLIPFHAGRAPHNSVEVPSFKAYFTAAARLPTVETWHVRYLRCQRQEAATSGYPTRSFFRNF